MIDTNATGRSDGVLTIPEPALTDPAGGFERLGTLDDRTPAGQPPTGPAYVYVSEYPARSTPLPAPCFVAFCPSHYRILAVDPHSRTAEDAAERHNFCHHNSEGE
jgi:hypothetical protein